MKIKNLLALSAIATSVYAGGNHSYDFTNEYFISKSPNLFNVTTPPNGLDTANIPQFISLGFDDNKYADGVDWVRDTLLAGRNNGGDDNKGTYDGTPMRVDFNVIGNSDYLWSETPHTAPVPTERPITASWRRAYDQGLGVNNHTWTHNYNLSDLKDDWVSGRPPLTVELGMCSQYMVNVMGMPSEHIYGFRTPYLASSISDNASFKVTRDIGVLYDCTLDNGMQGNQPATWAYPGWPGMMNDGWGPYTAVKTKGLWQIPNSIYQVTETGTFSDKGFDSGPKGWPGGATAETMFKQMRSAIIWAYNKNRAPVDLGLHSDYYSNLAQNTTGTAGNGFSSDLKERQKALVMLLDWIEAELPDARVVNKIDIIRWMRNPVELDDTTRNLELTFSETDKVLTLNAGGESYTSDGSTSDISGNTASVTIVDGGGNWVPDAFAGMKWAIGGSLNGMHSLRVTYKSDVPLRLMLIQDDMPEKEKGYYGIGLPTTLGETKTVELPIATDYFEPPRPYEATKTLDLSKVNSVALVGRVVDTTMSGSFSGDVTFFGAGGTSIANSPKNVNPTSAILNSFNSQRAELTIPTTGNYSVKIFTFKGKQLYSSSNSFAKGINNISWNSSLANGVYFIQVKGDNSSMISKLNIVR